MALLIKRRSLRKLFLGVLTIYGFLSVSNIATAGIETTLQDYVNKPDKAYQYQHLATTPSAGFSTHILSMNSQTWRSSQEVDKPLWQHQLTIIVPKIIQSDVGMIIVGGASNPVIPSQPSDLLGIAGQLAVTTGSIISVVSQTPNQPLKFSDHDHALSEDGIVAYSWKKAMDSGDFTWSVYLPMVKSVVRTMDTVQDYLSLNLGATLNQFVVTGFSKRGAATWLTAAVDSRVKAIAPGVIDFLNIAPHIEHHFSSYGLYSSAIKDYSDFNIVRRIRSPEGQNLLKVVDPYSYREQLALPKLILNSTGDQFFLPDSSQFYFNDLLGETLLRYVSNTDHSLSDSVTGLGNAFSTLATWYASQIYNLPRPRMRWHLQTGQLLVGAYPPPLKARLWKANNPTTRDFRKDTIGETWTSTELDSSNNGIFMVDTSQLLTPTGWTAYFVELEYPGLPGIPQTYSTSVYVTPDDLPFEVIDPLNEPKSKKYWKRQIKHAVNNTSSSTSSAYIDLAVLESYFPLPVLDASINTLDEAYDLFRIDTEELDDAEEYKLKALQHCLATRLNVKHKEIGWYTSIDLKKYGSALFWQHWQTANDAYTGGEYKTSKRICRKINRLEH